MTNVEDLFLEAIDNWRNAKGIGTALIPSPLNDKIMLLGVLQRIYIKNPRCKTYIIVNTFSERADIFDFLTKQKDDEENNKEFKELIDNGCIKVLTYSFVKQMSINFNPMLCVLYHPEDICEEIIKFASSCRFQLILLNHILKDAKEMVEIYKLAPILDNFKQAQIEQLRLSTPVEEYQVGITIPADSSDANTLNDYNEYITTSVTIFGSFDIIQQANRGNQTLNISANQICYNIATENGWNEHLDMSVEFNVEIDKLYNPLNLRERAAKTFEIIRLRSQFLSDYTAKHDEILKIVKQHEDKKILIINKRAEFASVVSDFINTFSEENICLPYHDKLDNVPAVDEFGDPVFYKGGAKKGERKMMGAQAQRTYAVQQFNKGNIRVLSTNNAPDKSLNIDVDVIIITSPTCEDIKSYIYRLSNVNFRLGKILLYNIYCRNTIEQKQLEEKTLAPAHSVKNNYNDETYSDFVVID